ncbi:response regulator transcription factor [Sphingomonas sp. AR_OL41]|uniref:response regulator transcription factor n=1 Tax=Sphingomonas sp. AR_OL41 TaxID=3042729 RepID=UPI00247FA19A|nr:response regulator transcription factor [Sphingomonas sp. AR_OL41]MDH7973188.1 response regulator transcription factor [Sphingomonas sp. AR_OL41]
MTYPSGNPAVIVVDDDISVREALQGLFDSVGLQSVLFGSVQEFLAAPLPEGPRCLVLDVRLPGRSGLDLQAELAGRDVPPPIIFLTGHGDIPMSVRAIKAGAVEFLVKPFRDQDLLDAIQIAIDRDREQRANQMVESELRARYEALTPRAREVMGMVASGLLNKQIAGKLNLSEVTVKVHRGQAMRKMGARSVAEIVRMADLLGLAKQQS